MSIETAAAPPLASAPPPPEDPPLLPLLLAAAALPPGPVPVGQHGWFPADAAIPRGVSRQPTYRARITAAGSVAGCTILESSGSPEADAATCEAVRTRGRFLPARDAAGTAIDADVLVRSPWPTLPSSAPRQSWVSDTAYPMRARAKRMQGTTEFAVDVSPDGRAHHCTIVRSSGHRLLDEETCKIVEKRARFRPAMLDRWTLWASYTDRVVWRLP